MKNKYPGIKDSRVLMYLNELNAEPYVNTDEENLLLSLWDRKFQIARNEYERSRCNSKNVKLWRDAYEGKINALDENGELTDKRLKAIRKVAYELVENKVNSHIPAVKMTPRYICDVIPVNVTEKLIMHNIDKMLSEQINDESEHNVLIDATSWFKVSWNPFDNTHERSGNPSVSICSVDNVYPQPGVKNYKDLEYIFEVGSITVSQCMDLYNRYIGSPTENDIIPTVTCYFLNEDRYVGMFMWCPETMQVICNDMEWGIRKRRECTVCHKVVNIEDECPVCHNHSFKYVPVKDEILQEDLTLIPNEYTESSAVTIPAGTRIPFYLVRQLPFVPYKRVSVANSIYGISEVELVLENQDLINKFYNKAEKKSLRSKTWVTKFAQTNIDNDGEDEVTIIDADSPEECNAIQVKQITSDISEEITQAQIMYDVGKSTVGVSDTDQGKADPTARSGKAKQLQLQASASREASPITLRNAAFAGVYELIFKYLLAYCDESRSFVSLLPDGTRDEQTWSKYMFLAQDDNGVYYYRDDYAFSVDTATEITQDRASMWALIDNDFINGTMGTTIDPLAALKMYWQMKEQYGYPLAKYALDFLEERSKHLPSDVEQALAQNPQAVEMALSMLQGNSQMASAASTAGGKTGPKSNNASHAANVEKTNNKNRSVNGNSSTNSTAASTGGMQGGTNG